MELSASPGMLLKAKEWIERKLFQKHYERSHLLYLKDRALGRLWDNIVEGIDVSYDLANIFSNDIPPTSRIAIRNTTGQKIDYIEILVTVDSYKGCQQNIITIKDMKERTYMEPLHNFPVDDVWFDERADGFLSSYDSFTVTLKKLVIDGETIKQNISKSPQHPMHNDILNGQFTKKWGTVYNLNLYKEGKFQLNHHLQKLIFGEYGGAYFARAFNRRNPNLFRTIKLKLFDLFSKDAFFSKVFWLFLLLGTIKVDDNGNILRITE